MVDSTQVVNEVAHPVVDFLNSGFGVLIIGTIFTLIGFFIRKLWTSISILDDKVLLLEHDRKDQDATRQSIKGLGERLGDTEKQIELALYKHNQLEAILLEIRADKKESNQIISDLYQILNEMKLDIAVLKARP